MDRIRTVSFRAARAEYVWNNISERRAWLPTSAAWRSASSWDDERRLLASTVAFITAAAFGYGGHHDAKYGSLPGRFEFLLSRSRHSLRLMSTVDLDLHLSLNLGKRPAEILDFGSSWGFGAVLPLSPWGMEQYERNECTAFDFGEAHLVCEGSLAQHVFLSGMVYVPEIDRPKQRPRSAKVDNGGPLFVGLLKQIASMIPPVTLEPEHGRWVVRRVDGNNSLPVLVCPISGNFKGGPFAKRAGFVQRRLRPDGTEAPCYRNRSGHVVWYLDFAEINRRPTSDAVRQRMLLLVRRLLQCSGTVMQRRGDAL